MSHLEAITRSTSLAHMGQPSNLRQPYELCAAQMAPPLTWRPYHMSAPGEREHLEAIVCSTSIPHHLRRLRSGGGALPDV